MKVLATEGAVVVRRYRLSTQLLWTLRRTLHCAKSQSQAPYHGGEDRTSWGGSDRVYDEAPAELKQAKKILCTYVIKADTVKMA